MRRLMTDFIADEKAAVSIEYALIASLVSIAVIGGAILVGQQLNASFTGMSTQLK